MWSTLILEKCSTHELYIVFINTFSFILSQKQNDSDAQTSSQKVKTTLVVKLASKSSVTPSSCDKSNTSVSIFLVFIICKGMWGLQIISKELNYVSKSGKELKYVSKGEY